MSQPSPSPPAPAATPRAFACPRCGAAMAFDPARAALACASCSFSRALPPPTVDAMAQALQEQDYLEALRRLAAREPTLEARVVDCPACGAQSRFEGHVVGSRCAFCATPLLLENSHVERLIQAQALLPFALTRTAAEKVFARWVRSRWFAPDALKRTVSRADGIQGVYMPWWTFDANTATRYSAQRGIRRQVLDNHPGASARGGANSRTITEWEATAGAVQVAFDDILVAGSTSVPPHLARVLDRWNLSQLQPASPELMAGFTVEVYRVPLEPAFVQARARMEPAIEAAIRSDVGGDEQRIDARQTVVDDIRFKHLLLPVWLGSYRFGGKVYQVVVNGQTGELEGDRPYSKGKIILAVVLALLVILWIRLQQG